MDLRNETAPLIYEFCNMQGLAKLGFRQDLSDLSCFEVDYLTLIASEFISLEDQEMKRKSRKK